MDDFDLGGSSRKKKGNLAAPAFNRFKTSPNLIQGDQDVTVTIKQNDNLGKFM